jgi:N-acetylneuraminic acid mutarotase
MKSIRYIFAVLLCFSSSIAIAQWTQKNHYPGGLIDQGYTDAVVEFTIGDTVYIGGGSAGDTCFYKFDPTSNQWTAKHAIPPRAFGVSFTIGSKGYMALGQSDPTNAGQASVTNDLWQYDPTTDQWTKEANFPGKARDAAFAFVVGNKAYVGGGTDTGYNVYRDFYSYDPSINKWDTLGFLPDYLYFNSTFVIGNYGYVATGVETTNEISSMWQYDPSKDSWNQMSAFPGAPRESAVAFALNGMGYLGLGQSEYTTVFKDFYSYDPTQDQWTSVTSFPATNGRGWAAGVATSSAAFVGLGTFFSGANLYAENDFWEFAPTAGVATTPANNPNVYPNPAQDFVTVSLPQGVASAQVGLRNEIGALCLTTQINSNQGLNVSSLSPGIYNLEITSGEYHAVQRIIKE